MAYTIGAVLSIGGEKEYMRAMAGIRDSMKYVKAEAGAITSAFDKGDKSVEALTTKNKALSMSYDVQQKAVDEAKAALERMKSEGVDPSSDAYKKMTANLNSAQAELNKTSHEIENNKQAISQLNEEAKAEKMQKFTDALKSAGEVAGTVVKAGLKAAATAMAAVGAAAVAAAAGIWKIGRDAGIAADYLITLSNQTGINVETLQGMQYAARFVDVEVESLARGMARTVAAMRQATDAGRDYVEASGGIKVALKDSTGAMKSTEQIFYDTIDAIGALEDATMRDVAAQDIFGKSYQDLMPLILEGASVLNVYAEEARAAGLILSEEMIAKLGEFDDVMQRTEAQAIGLGRQLAVTFLPALQSVGEGISEFLSVIMTTLRDGIQAGDIAVIGEWLSKKIVDGLKQIKKYIPEVISVISGMLREVVKIIVTTLPTIMPMLLDGAFQLIDGLLSAIVVNAQPLAEMAVSMITNLTMFLLENLPLLIEAAAQILVAIASGMAESLPTLIPAVIQAIMEIVNTLIANVGLIIPAAIEIMVALIQGLAAAIPQLIAYLPTIISTIVTTLLENLPLLVEASIQIIIALTLGIVEAIPELVEAIPQIIEAIVKALGGLTPKLWEAGKSIVVGIWEGIQRAEAWFREKITTFFKNIIDSVKGVLGIRSPSKVFAEIGENMAMGLGIGFENAMRDVSKSINANIPTDVSFKAIGSGVGQPVINVYTHDSLSPYEIMQEAVNAQRRLVWGQV